MDKLLEQLRGACLKESISWPIAATSEKHAGDDLVKSSERDDMVSYLLEVCEREDMALGIDTFALFVALLDRFLANYKVKSKYLECLSVASLYVAAKVKEDDDNISITSEFLLDCNCKHSVAELLRMEQMILVKFDWSVNDITPVDFLHIYYALLVAKHNELEAATTTSTAASRGQKQSTSGARSATHRWRKKHKRSSTSSSLWSRLLASDFLLVLEHKLKQCMCVHELTRAYRPHLLAYSLVSMQLDEMLLATASTSSDDEGIARSAESLSSMLDTIQATCKLSTDAVDACKQLIGVHLASMDIDDTSSMMQRYIGEYMASVTRTQRTPLLLNVTELDVINEEEEGIGRDESAAAAAVRAFNECLDDDQAFAITLPTAVVVSEAQEIAVLKSVVNTSLALGRRTPSQAINCDGCWRNNNNNSTSDSTTATRDEQKRKLSDNSNADEDTDSCCSSVSSSFDENRLVF